MKGDPYEKNFNLSAFKLQEYCNLALETTLKRLLFDDVIDTDTYEHAQQYAAIIAPPSTLTQFLRNFLTSDSGNDLRLLVVKVLGDEHPGKDAQKDSVETNDD
jgi:hypothetical protein